MTSKRLVPGLVALGLIALAGAASWGQIRQVTRPAGPSPPDVLTVIAGERNTLSWMHEAEAGGRVRIYRAPASSGPYVELGTTSSGTFVDDPPAPGIFWYRLAVIGADGEEGPPSEPVSSDRVELSSVVGPQGGTLEPTTGTVRLDIPPGAVEAPTTFTIAQVSSPPQTDPGRVLVSRVFDIGPTGTRFATAATLTLRYEIPHDLDRSSSNPSSRVTARFWDTASGSWVTPPGGSTEQEGSATVATRIKHLSLWAADLTIPHGGYSSQTHLCEVCHDWHGEGYAYRLLVRPTELEVCYMCHGGTDSLEPNIETEFGDGMRVSFHPVPAPAADGAQLACSDCHAEHQSPSKDVGLLYVPLGPEDFRTSPPEDPIGNDFCYSCHPANADVQEQVVHNQVDPPNPGTGVTCTACHAPHAADFPHLMKEDEDTLCLTCHAGDGPGPDVSAAFTDGMNDYGSTVRIYHHPVATADQAATPEQPNGTRVVECTSCHNTHLPGTSLVVDPTDTTTLWTGTTSEFCMTCHQEQPPDDPVIAAGAKVPYAVRMVPDGHDLFSASQWPSSIHGGTALECTDCHDQHGSSNAYMLTETGGLTGFTDTEADGTNLQNLCVSCHEHDTEGIPTDQWVQEKHNGVSNFAGIRCTTCHYHTSERF